MPFVVTPRRERAVLACPICSAPLRGAQKTCSDRCRQRRARAARAERLAAVRDLLDRQTAALASGADPGAVAALAREARRILGDVGGPV